MSILTLSNDPHVRFNPLKREWVLVSPNRNQRPWQGQVEKAEAIPQMSYDPACYLCPGNKRANGIVNPDYRECFAFDNDYPAVQLDVPHATLDEGLFQARAESGVCRVVSFSPRHDLSLSTMETGAIRKVVDIWSDEYIRLGNLPAMNHVQIFENRGSMMGCSNPHPHSQIWATATIPNEPAMELASSIGYSRKTGSCLLCDYLAQEEKAAERVVVRNRSFIALVPFWAVWPFEILLIARRHFSSMDELSELERDDLAEILKRISSKYDHLFGIPFPYSMGFHQSPTDGADHSGVHFHAHYYPPLLRSATVRKFMVGFELLGSPQRDLTPESAADILRRVPDAGTSVSG